MYMPEQNWESINEELITDEDRKEAAQTLQDRLDE